MADISAIKLPNNTTYTLKDKSALPLTGGSVTGPVSFGDSVSIDEATIGDLVVNGSGSFTNNLQANTINGVAVGNSPKFTDTNTTYSAGTGLSLSSTTFNHTNSVTAQTTQAVYPIKIDAQGHISAYGSAVTIPTVPSNIVNTITTTAGVHTAISNQKGNVSFNVPTKTSHLTNDSGFITTDNKVKQALSTSNTAQPILFRNNVSSGTGDTTEETRYVNTVTITPSTGAINATHINSEDMSAQDVSDFVDSLNTTGIHAVDYVVAQGTSGNWTYRKWNNGVAECWAYFRYTSVAMTTSEGSGYYAPLKTENFPSGLFYSAAPVVTVGAELNGSLGGFAISTTSKTSMSGYLWATKSATRNAYLHVHAIGEWK